MEYFLSREHALEKEVQGLEDELKECKEELRREREKHLKQLSDLAKKGVDNNK